MKPLSLVLIAMISVTALPVSSQTNIAAKTVLGNSSTSPAPATALTVPSTAGVETYAAGASANQKRWLLQPCGGCASVFGWTALDALVLSPVSDAGVPWYANVGSSNLGAISVIPDPFSHGQVNTVCLGTDGANQPTANQAVLDCFGNNDFTHMSTATGDNTIFWTMASNLQNDVARIVFGTGGGTALEMGAHSGADTDQQPCSMFAIPNQNYLCATFGPLSIGVDTVAVIGLDTRHGTTGGSVTVKPTGPNSTIALTATRTTVSGGLVSGGASFTVSGCSAGTFIGGANAGSFVVGSGASPCSFTITMGASATAPHGWVCNADDITTGPTHFANAAVSTTSCTVKGNASAGDAVQFSAIGY